MNPPVRPNLLTAVRMACLANGLILWMIGAAPVLADGPQDGYPPQVADAARPASQSNVAPLPPSLSEGAAQDGNGNSKPNGNPPGPAAPEGEKSAKVKEKEKEGEKPEEKDKEKKEEDKTTRTRASYGASTLKRPRLRRATRVSQPSTPAPTA